jgi:hypothetical protein
VWLTITNTLAYYSTKSNKTAAQIILRIVNLANGTVSLPLSDVILAQLAYSLSDGMFCLHSVGCNHRHLSNINCLSFVMCRLLSPLIIGFFSFFFAAAIYSTNETNKAGGMRH